MKNKIKILFIIIAFCLILSCDNRFFDQELIKGRNTLSQEEIAEGWKLLFDGQTMNGWREFKEVEKEKIKGWQIIKGNLVNMSTGKSIITVDTYNNFDLKIEWMLYTNANSGIMYFVSEDKPKSNLEYQIIDEVNYPDDLKEWQRTGSCYGLYPTVNAEVKPVGEYNSSHITINNNHVEHWLNGKRVVEYEIGSEDWKRKVTARIKNYSRFGFERNGHIALQVHNGIICYKNIKIREINNEKYQN